MLALCTYQLYAHSPPSGQQWGKRGRYSLFCYKMWPRWCGVRLRLFSIKYMDIYLMVFSSLCDSELLRSFTSTLHAGAVASPATGSFTSQPLSTPVPIDIHGKILHDCVYEPFPFYFISNIGTLWWASLGVDMASVLALWNKTAAHWICCSKWMQMLLFCRCGGYRWHHCAW